LKNGVRYKSVCVLAQTTNLNGEHMKKLVLAVSVVVGLVFGSNVMAQGAAAPAPAAPAAAAPAAKDDAKPAKKKGKKKKSKKG